MPTLQTFTALRYIQPLREGGSLPAVVDTDGGMFVVKFRGAGQGARALIAEIVVAGLARILSLPVPDVALVDVREFFGRSEPDPEIQDLLRASHGINVGLRYLDGAFNLALSAARDCITPEFAARVVWLDAFTTNPDRTHHNPNILLWGKQPWLIDHGAALYVHHDWDSVDAERTRTTFPLIRNHVLLGAASSIADADSVCASLLDSDSIRRVLEGVPDDLLVHPVASHVFATAADARQRYMEYFQRRLAAPREFAIVAESARREVAGRLPERVSARR